MNAFFRSLLAVTLTLLVWGCAEEMGESADLVLRDGAVWTGAGAGTVEGVAVREGRIVAAGSGREVSRWIGDDTRVVDLGGRTVTPGIVDSHVHFLSGGFQLSSVDLRDAGSPSEFGRRISRFTREHPVFVTRLDGHMGLANSLALEAAGIDAAGARTPDPAGGSIERDPETGEATGILRDAAMNRVFSAIPPSTEEELDRALDAAAAHAVSRGVTQAHDMATFESLETYRRARTDGRLWWGGLKGFVDGSLGSTTAWFYDPYTDEPGTSGLITTDTASIRRWTVSADSAGLQVMVHAIGDRANDWLLDLYAAVGERNGPRDGRFRIEHAQHLSPEAIDRFGDLGVIASMQPYHAADDGRWAESRIGPERIRTTYAFRSLLDAGARVAFGSDWTVAPLDPTLGFDAALTRRTIDGLTVVDGEVVYERGSGR